MSYDDIFVGPVRPVGRPRTRPIVESSKYLIKQPRITVTGAREFDMRDMYRHGSTLQEIGNKYSITRERVRQLLLKFFGMSRIDGGETIQMFLKVDNQIAKKRERLERLDKSQQKRYGISLERRLSIVEMYGLKIFRAFKTQRGNARNRGIAWELSFKQWLDIWEESGKLGKRGRGHDKYVMARFGDTDGYKLGNCFICRLIENSSDRPQKKHGLPIGVSKRKTGKFTACKMINGKSFHLGTFDTVEEAALKYEEFQGHEAQSDRTVRELRK